MARKPRKREREKDSQSTTKDVYIYPRSRAGVGRKGKLGMKAEENREKGNRRERKEK